MTGFITEDGYAAVPFVRSYMVLYNGEQLDVVKTIKKAEQFIQQHRDTLKTAIPETEKVKASANVKRKTK